MQLHLPVGEDAADVDDAGTLVDVASLERKPLLWPQSRQPGEHGQRAPLGRELVADCLEFGHRYEGGHLATFRLGVRHLTGDVLVEQLRPNGVVDRLHGLTPSLAIIDELHAHPDDEVYLALRTAMLKRPGSKLIVISTAGQGTDSPLGRLRARALAQPKVTRCGAVTDAQGSTLRLLEWSVPEDADVDDPKVVRRANPASWIMTNGLREQRQAVPDLAFRRFHANQWTEREGHWLPAGAWHACVGRPEFVPGEDIWIGVDVGGERSASAVVWINAYLHVGCAVYHGDQGVLDCVDHVRELAGKYRVRELCFDPWRFGQAAQELEREGIPVVAFPQTDARMIPASDRLYRAIIEKRLVLPDHEELRQHAATAIARHSRRGWRLDKTDRADSIDSVIALCMALERAEHKPEPVALLGWL